MDLLQNYAETRDERAFRALVDAHLGMVYGTAMRRLGDPPLSEEVAQNVFNALAKKAKTIRSAKALPAWLHRATLLECSKAIRGESRRRQRMGKLIEITALEGDGQAAWKHAQYDLDEAVNELPATDREILFQRFYEDMSYRDIATASGKSEAASQKHASRALAKLGELMRARGFAVPAAVLAAALSAELCKAAPAKLAATVSSTALASATVSTINLFRIMSIAKSTATALTITLSLIAIFTGGGYVAGVSAAKVAQREANTGAGVNATPAPPRPPRSAKVTSIPDVPRGSVREILEAAADHFEIPAKLEDGRREIGKLRPDEIQSALAELSNLDLDTRVLAIVRWEIVRHWAKSDGPAAAAYALANSADDTQLRGISSALFGWCEHSPAKAYEWFRQNIDGGSQPNNLRSISLQTVIRSWAAKDPVTALAALAELPYDDQRNLTSTLGRLAREAATRVPYLEELRRFPDPNIRSQLLDAALDTWSKADPPAAAVWFDTLEFESPRFAMKAAQEIGENWYRVDPAQAASWMLGKIPDAMKEEFIEEAVRGDWAVQDPEAAAAWLKANGYEN